MVTDPLSQKHINRQDRLQYTAPLACTHCEEEEEEELWWSCSSWTATCSSVEARLFRSYPTEKSGARSLIRRLGMYLVAV